MLRKPMESFRLFLALVILYIMPIVITFWVVIHAFSDTWRNTNPMRAYAFAGLCIVLVTAFCYSLQNILLGSDLGNSLALFLVGAAIYLASWFLWRPVKHHLDFKTFAGIPEVTNEKISLITDGPFAMVRHPRYLMVWIGVLGWCLMANYSGAYAIGIASMFGLLIIVNLEERDLIKRFGDEYRAYQKNVPQLIPTRDGVRDFISNNFRKQ